MDDLINSSNSVSIVNSRNGKNTADPNGTYILWSPTNTDGGPNQGGGTNRPAYIGLSHEMAHIQDNWNGTLDNSTWTTVNGKSIANHEKYATHIENQIRAENNIPLRTHYAIFIGRGGRIGLESTRIIIERGSLFYTTQQKGMLPIPFKY